MVSNKAYNVAPVDVKRRRSVFKFNHTVKFDGSAGDLIPIEVVEVLPGDSFSVDFSSVIRMATPMFPVMDDCFFDVFAFFVPNRLLWKHWQELCGENVSSYWAENVDWVLPGIYDAETFGIVGSAVDYLGYMGANAPGPGSTIQKPVHTDKGFIYGNFLNLVAYGKVWNDWFRDQNTQAPQDLAFEADNGFDLTANWKPQLRADISTPNSLITSGGLLPINKVHDYFTSCLPSPQKGDAVNFSSVTGQLDVKARSKNDDSWLQPFSIYNENGLGFGDMNESNQPRVFRFGSPGSGDTVVPSLKQTINLATNESEEYTKVFVPKEYVDIADASTVSINSFRIALQTQSFLENDARGGTRYIELLKSHFGVSNGDLRLQRPEFLGAKRIPITTNQVSNTASDVGNLGGFTYGSANESFFTKSFTEHGILLIVGGLLTRHTYGQGFDRSLMRKSRFDYYWPEFANIGEQPVYKAQLFGEYKNSPFEVFGFQEAWAEYREFPNRVRGHFRPDCDGTLSNWTYTDNFGLAPSLDFTFMKEVPNNIDRTIAVSSNLASQFIADIYFSGSVARELPLFSVPASLL